jgi:hypothetical protein
MLEVLQNNYAGSFSKDEPIAIQIERSARTLRLFVSLRQRGEQTKPRHPEGMDHALGTPG